MTTYKMTLPLTITIFLSFSAVFPLFPAMAMYSLSPELISYILLIFVVSVIVPLLMLLFIRRISYETLPEGLKVRTPIMASLFSYSEIVDAKKLVGRGAGYSASLAYGLSLKRRLLKPALGFEILFNKDPVIIETNRKKGLFTMSIAVNPENKEEFMADLKKRLPQAK